MKNIEFFKDALLKNNEPLSLIEIKSLIMEYKKTRDNYLKDKYNKFNLAEKTTRLFSYFFPFFIFSIFYIMNNEINIWVIIFSLFTYFMFSFSSDYIAERKKYLPNFQTNLNFPMDDVMFISKDENDSLISLLKNSGYNSKSYQYILKANRDLIYAEYRMLLEWVN